MNLPSFFLVSRRLNVVDGKLVHNERMWRHVSTTCIRHRWQRGISIEWANWCVFFGCMCINYILVLNDCVV